MKLSRFAANRDGNGTVERRAVKGAKAGRGFSPRGAVDILRENTIFSQW